MGAKFADPNFVLMNGEYFESSENRRYVQAHAWLTEFTDILLEWILQSEPNPKYYNKYYGCNEPLTTGGPLEILNYLKDNADVIANNDINVKTMLEREIRKIATLRNKITHKKVQDSSPLLELLNKMESVCR
jgi:hypothetical protein